MALTREQVEKYFKAQGRPDADESWYDEFMNAEEMQPLYDEIVQNEYDLSDVDRWFHLKEVLGVDLPFKTAMKIDGALWEADLETMELNLPEYRVFGEQKVNGIFRGSFDEVKERIRTDILQKDSFELHKLSNVRVPDLTLEDAFKLCAELRSEADGAKTLFLIGRDQLFDLSRSEDVCLLPYEFKKIVDQYLAPEEPLYQFIEREVPFRMREFYGIDVPDNYCSDLIDLVKENMDVMFDYDRFDAFILSKYEELLGVDKDRLESLRGEICNLRKELEGAIEFDPDMVPVIDERLCALLEEMDALYGIKPLEFIFDDELMLNDDNITLNGYVWAVDGLVKLLPNHEEVENVSFYPEYNVVTGEITLMASYDTPCADGELNKTAEIILTKSEKKRLIEAMEAHCHKRDGCSCLSLVNFIRGTEGLEHVTPEGDSVSLEEKIRFAENGRHDVSDTQITQPLLESEGFR